MKDNRRGRWRRTIGIGKSARRAAGRGEKGYTLLLALFFAAVMIIAASAAVPNLITQDIRQKEKLMIWRGRQYARAIGLYYRKTGHFPHDLRELAHGVNGIHFLRQRYKDPMDPNGSWRLIYLGAGGQLIGSLCWKTLAEYQAAQLGEPLVTSVANATGLNSAAAGKQKTAIVPTCGMFGQNPDSSYHPQAIQEGGMVGGNLIGVGGEVDHPSIKHYMGADSYRYWEFIWNPQKGTQLTIPGAAQPSGPVPAKNSNPFAPPGASPGPASPAPSRPPAGNNPFSNNF